MTYDPCSPLVVAAVPGADAEEVTSVEDAVDAWRRVLRVQIEVRAGPQDAASLPVIFESDTFYRAMYWDVRGEIAIGRENLAAGDYAIAIAHELGHAFGLPHVSRDVHPSVMHVGNLEIAPTDEDGAAVRALWSTCTTGGGG